MFLPKTKPISLIFYRPPNQRKFLEILGNDVSRLNTENNGICLLDEFNVNFNRRRKIHF